MFSWESCEIFNSTYFTEHLRMIAFVVTLSLFRTLSRVKSNSKQALQITKAGDNCSEKLFWEILYNSQENIRFELTYFVNLHLYWKKNSMTDIFLWIQRNFSEKFFV